MTSPTTTLTSNDDDSSEAATDVATKNAASSRSRFPFIAGLLAAVAGALVVVLVPHHRQARPETRGCAGHADLPGQEQPLSVQ